MRKIQNLTKNIKRAIFTSAESKIIAGSIATLLVGGVIIGGIVVYNNSNSDKELPRISEKEVKKEMVNQKPIEKTEEEKDYDEKVLKINDIVKNIKDLDSEFKPEEVDKGNIDSLLEKYINLNKELVAKAQEVSKELDKKAEEENKAVASNSSVSTSPSSTPSNSGSSSSTPSVSESVPTTPVQVEQPKPEPIPAPVATVPSGWRDDIANYIVSYGSTPGVTNTTAFVTQDSLNFANASANAWLNGSGATISSINAESQANHAVNNKLYLKIYTLKSFTIKGTNKDVIAEATLGNSNGPGQVDFLWCKVYYDGTTDTCTVYMSDGALGV